MTMTDNHPITPSQELVDKWVAMLEYCEDIDVFSDIARWGADQELEACCEWAADQYRGLDFVLRAARRPKPPSLKEQALAVIENSAICDHLSPEHAATLRRALEQLDD